LEDKRVKGGEKELVKIRLMRMGAKKRPFYRVVVTDSREKRSGKTLDILGYYNPIMEPAEIKVDLERAKEWLSKGAQPTHQAKNILKVAGL
jgi:small subunit ribosomal protein S16